jgi:hypothetical protein
MMFNFLKKLDLSKEVESSVSSNLKRILDGQKDVYTSPIVGKRSPEQILADWDRLYTANRSLVNDVLDKLEQSNRSKFGPRSIALPWVDRIDGVLSYFKAEDKKFTAPPVPKDARRNLRPISMLNAMREIKNDTNSGLPYYRRKGQLKELYMSRFMELLGRKDPCVMFTRTQELLKTRTVWGYPFADVIFEMMFYIPLLAHQKTLEWRNSLKSPDAVNKKATELIKYCQENKDYQLLSIDFSAYDASVKTTLQRACFEYIKSLYQLQYAADIDRIFQRFNTIGLLTPIGVMLGSHGVPSGSTFTNEVDSIAQFLIALSFGLSPLLFDIQGDDGIYCVRKPRDLMSHFQSYGLQVNEDKSYISKDFLVYLQCLYHIDYMRDGIIGGIYPTYRALNRIIYLERFIDLKDEMQGKDYFSIRTICILENCKYSPLFRQLVEYVAGLDKYNLEFSEEGLRSYIKRVNQSNGTSGVFKFRYEDDPSGIESFETVKILRELYRG